MGEQKDEESRMYCNISHADMRQGRKRLLMTPRIKGRIVQFCAKHGVSGKTLPDGRTCVALMKHVGFFTADTSVFRHVTSKVLAWIQSNVSQAKMSGVLKEERVGTEGKRQHHWAIQYAVAAGDWMDKDYNPFESGFGQTKDVQFAEPILRQSHSLDAAVNAAVDAAVLDAEGEAYTPSAVLRRKSHHEKDDTVMDEARDLSETALSHPSLPRSPALSTTSPDSFGESPFHQAIAHMMVVANNSTMEQVQAYLNSEQGIKDAIARLFVDDQKTHPELRSEELLQTREHAHALAIENGRMQERIRDLEHKLSILSEVTNHPEYIALDCRLRTTEAELSLARKDAVLEKVKSVDYLNLQQRCEGLDN
ncbi:hypothetical protein AC579_2939 [Pseudocercospora musae]|uniref:Uncharacterized protein n=1 Tax=Pseudocercospora musae TaxID=113226 RepID=A0A139GZ33_9PEZI|nr:hypothetical protein AC579_2939 [Pseudocercospora musae]